MSRTYVKNKNQKDAYTSPWSKKESILIRIWELVWILFVRWLPKFCYPWYCLLLRLFGCKIHGKPFIAPSCRIYAPWLLEIHNKACIGLRSEVYNLGPVKIKERAVIAQYSYLCNGTHDFSDKKSTLLVGDMEIEEDVFIGAKAIILPGIIVRKGTIVGAGSVLTKDTKEFGVYVGNPAKYIKDRIIRNTNI
ncbi:DapH/DapD/GlmU-related protein [Clostridium perfringens]|nr:hypothetical protein [Clostridium perfringens]EIF6169240.1 hypothetical protein [Clostridium perfringens]MDU1810052.1 DapH/DapD/GlmU-related protein [Clostridium perfringens]